MRFLVLVFRTGLGRGQGAECDTALTIILPPMSMLCLDLVQAIQGPFSMARHVQLGHGTGRELQTKCSIDHQIPEWYRS